MPRSFFIAARTMVRASLVVLALLGSVLLAAPPAAAHAILMESMPAADGAVTGPRVALTLRYNSRIDRKRSRLTLTAPDKGWQVLAIDGHITRGDIPFTVAAP